jgi:hypothetical protein
MRQLRAENHKQKKRDRKCSYMAKGGVLTAVDWQKVLEEVTESFAAEPQRRAPRKRIVH